MALNGCPKCKKLPNLVTLVLTYIIYLENGVGDRSERSVVGKISHFEDIEPPVVEVHHQLKALKNGFIISWNNWKIGLSSAENIKNGFIISWKHKKWVYRQLKTLKMGSSSAENFLGLTQQLLAWADPVFISYYLRAPWLAPSSYLSSNNSFALLLDLLFREWIMTSVTRFGKISPLWQNFTSLWQISGGLFIIWQIVEPKFGDFYQCKWPNIEK